MDDFKRYNDIEQVDAPEPETKEEEKKWEKGIRFAPMPWNQLRFWEAVVVR